MKCFSYLVVLLANHLVETIGKVIANWSLDTVNTLPLALARQVIAVNRTISSGNKLTHLENVFDHDEKTS